MTKIEYKCINNNAKIIPPPQKKKKKKNDVNVPTQKKSQNK